MNSMQYNINNNSHSDYRREIDGLRALAVGMVVLYHAFPNHFPGGFIGVDVFFFLSGYLITGNLLRDLACQRFSLLDFYARRIRRIFPALLLVIACVFFIGWLLLGPYDFRELGKHGAAGAAFIANILLYKQAGYFAAPSELKPFLHLWSLAVEEQYYFFWPILLAAFWRCRNWLLFLFLIAFVFSFGANIYYFEKNSSAAFFLLPFRFWQLVVGGFWAYLETSRSIVFQDRYKLWNILGGISLGALLFSCFYLNKETLYPGWWALIPAFAPFFLLAPRFPSFWQRIFQYPLLVFLGLISYPLYLWHWPLLAILRIRSDSEPALLYRIIAIVLSVLLAWLTYRWLELPIRQRFRFQNAREKWRIVIAGGSIAVLLFVVGLAIKAKKIEPYLKNKNPIRYELEKYAEYDNSDTRLWKCFYESSTEFKGFASECLSQNSQLPNLLLLGDSHAAHLYPGLVKEITDWNIIQLNTSKCPPFPNLDGKHYLPNCLLANQKIFSQIKAFRIQTVIMQARWSLYIDQPNFISDLLQAVQYFEKIGVKVIVLGASPTWIRAVPRQLIQQFVEKNLAIPDLVPEAPEAIAIRADAILQKKLPKNYVSILQNFCPEGKCPIYANGAQELFVYDDSHLSRAGAAEVSRKLIKGLLKKSSNFP